MFATGLKHTEVECPEVLFQGTVVTNGSKVYICIPNIVYIFCCSFSGHAIITASKEIWILQFSSIVLQYIAVTKIECAIVSVWCCLWLTEVRKVTMRSML